MAHLLYTRAVIREDCNFCARPADVDGKTLLGPWAYMCAQHARQFGNGLGGGRGQLLNPTDAECAFLDAAFVNGPEFVRVSALLVLNRRATPPPA